MGGPWFTVTENGTGWKRLDTIWISNGESNDRAHVELSVQLEEAQS